MSIEDEFGLEVPDDQIENFRTVGDVVRYIEEIPEHLPDDDPPCAQQGDFLCACGANGKEEESKQ